MSMKPKKIALKELKPISASQNPFESNWVKVNSFLEALYASNGDLTLVVASGHDLQELYKIVTDICLAKQQEKLTSEFQLSLSRHSQKLFQRAENVSQIGTEFLKVFSEQWTISQRVVDSLLSVFAYLDRSLNSQKSKSIKDIHMSILRDIFESNRVLLSNTLQSVLQIISNERSGIIVEIDCLQSVIHLMSQLSLYKIYFERHIIESANRFYLQAGNEKITGDIGAYLQFVEDSFQSEKRRVNTYLPVTSLTALISTVEDNLLLAHLNELFVRFKGLLEEVRYVDLKKFFTLLSRVNQLDRMRLDFGDYVRSKAKLIVSARDFEKTSKNIIPGLISLRDEMEKIIQQCFTGLDIFVTVMKTAIEAAVDGRELLLVELVAKFINSIMTSQIASNEFEKLIDKVIGVLRAVRSMDVFKEYYKKDLGNRLLFGRVVSLENEKKLVEKLSSEIGHSFSANIDVMFRDIENTALLQHQFASSFPASSGFAASFNVLTQEKWPKYEELRIRLPSEMSSRLGAFEEFYRQTETNRKLLWRHGLSHCLLTMNLPSGPLELDVSLTLAVILLSFNDSTSMTYQALSQCTNLEEKELNAALFSLIRGNGILRKVPENSEIQSSDVFILNENFKPSSNRLKITGVQIKEPTVVVEEVAAPVAETRDVVVKAAIVRVMKSKRRLTHNALISEVESLLLLPVDVPVFKKCISSLVDADYLERDSLEPDVYLYCP